MIAFTIPGPPVAKGRPRVAVRGDVARAYTPPRTAAYEARVAAACPAEPPPDGPLRVDLLLLLPRPASRPVDVSREVWAGRGRAPRCTARDDVDNLAKAILDGMQLRGWLDNDGRIAELRAVRLMAAGGEATRVEVVVSAWRP